MALTEPGTDLLSELEALEAAVPGARAEFIGGQFVVNRPVNLHQHTTYLVMRYLDERYVQAGECVLAEVRVKTPDGYIIPDVVVAEDHWLDSTDPIPVVELLLAVDVLSPSTEATDRGAKRKTFQAAHVDYWLAEQAKTVQIAERYGYGGGRFS